MGLLKRSKRLWQHGERMRFYCVGVDELRREEISSAIADSRENEPYVGVHILRKRMNVWR